MAVMEKLSIMGIRSFGPNESQKIEFFKPVTLVVGANGTGKTTVIECLKYITTGELPPGSRNGGYFVHDPKMADVVTVRAKVGIQFTDVSGRSTVACRTIESKQLRDRIAVNTLDTTLKRVAEDGSIQSLNQKCAFQIKEMVSSLGVSKAVLEYVIFCHQEDANWPLLEGKAVKQRFDDIFASSQYVKVLEEIRNSKKELDQDVKVLNRDVHHYRELKNQAEEKQRHLETTQMRLEVYKKEEADLKAKLEPIEQKLLQYRQNISHVESLRSSIVSGKETLKAVQRNIEHYENSIRKQFNGSDDELERALVESEKDLLTLQHSVSVKTKELENKSADADSLNNKNNRLKFEQGKLEQDVSRLEHLKKTIANLSTQILKSRGENVAIRNEYSPELIEQLKSYFSRHEDEIDLELNNLYTEFSSRDRALQEELDSAKEEKTRIEQRVASMNENVSKNERSIREAKARLISTQDAMKMLNKYKSDLQAVKDEISTLERDNDINTMKRRLNELQAEEKASHHKIEALDQQIDKAASDSEIRCQIEYKQKEVQTKKSKLDRLRNKNDDTLSQLFSSGIPSENLSGHLADLQSQSSSAIRKSETELNTLKQKLVRLETEQSHTSKLIGEKENMKRLKEAKIYDACGSSKYDDAVKEIQDRKLLLEDQKAEIQGESVAYNKFLSKLSSSQNAPCPLCHRSFAEKCELDEVISDLRAKLKLLPKQLKAKEAEHLEASDRFEKLLKLQSVNDELANISEHDLPALSLKLSSMQEDSEKLRKEIVGMDGVLSLYRDEYTLAQSVTSDASLMDSLTTDIQRLQCQIDGDVAKLGDTGVLSLEDLTSQRNSLRKIVASQRLEIDSSRRKVDVACDKLQKLRTRSNELMQKCLETEQANLDKAKFEESLQRLTEENKILEADIKDKRSGIPHLEKTIRTLLENKEEKLAQKSASEKILRQKSDNLKKQINEVDSYIRDLTKLQQQGVCEKLEATRNEISEALSTAERLRKESNALKVSLDDINQRIANHELNKRELEDCRQLRRLQVDKKSQMEAIAKLQSELGDLNVRDLEKDFEKLSKEEEVLRKSRQVNQAKIIQYQAEVNQLTSDLGGDFLKDASSKYNLKMIEVRISELSSKDLEKFYRALDAAITRYHTQKMNEINKIIRHLWRTTYRGNDIDFIEIRSDEDESGVSKARRTFNYRVVMMKHGTLMDMRGRCSAGQKVLCSLIIRLALAEAFCINCGILALDEPTTNLDRENIESLANALVEIIRTRAKQQKNFQMIVITHDEEFLELLGRCDLVENYFRIIRRPDGLSEIHKQRISDLN